MDTATPQYSIQPPDDELDSPSPSSSPPDVLVTVRFSASIPDMQLEIPSANTTTAAGLKQMIRARLPKELANRRIRLICSGRGLEDATSLTQALRIPGPESSSTSVADEEGGKGKGKGKAPVPNPPHVYVHCSIGDISLSSSDLAAEAAISTTRRARQSQTTATGVSGGAQTENENSVLPAPRGFDRLLSAGFTPAEVSALRSQFLALLSLSRTPDTMPSGAELRELEDRWMDEGSGAGGATLGGLEGGGRAGGPFSGEDDSSASSSSALDDMLWGAVMGFFWPVGCAMWLRREENVWSWRKGLAVFVGVAVNVGFGAVRILN